MVIKPTRGLKCLLKIILIALFIADSAATAENGFRQITGPCDLNYPSDHGPHTDYRTEWWYYTGNLTDAQGHRFGFQLTFFRSALQPPEKRSRWPESKSAWRTDQIYLAHAAITDIDEGRHLQAEQMARQALSMAGARQSAETVTIHLNTWQATIKPDSQHLKATTGEFSFALDLKPAKPLIVHGEKGYSRKGSSPEQASCYASFTRLSTIGTLTIAGQPYAVQGLAWMDHEFSTAPLAADIIGWDWFSLQLSNGSEIMLYMLRQADGTMNPSSSGTLVPPSGQARHLQPEDIAIQPLAYWTSPRSNARYPVKWRVTIANPSLDLTVTARLEDQEMQTPQSTDVTYWEGSVQADGNYGGTAVSGVGYVELTGYAKPFDAPM